MDAATGELVRKRAGSLCEYRHLPQEFSGLRFHIEHIVPRQHDGTDDTSNLALACPECNLRNTGDRLQLRQELIRLGLFGEPQTQA